MLLQSLKFRIESDPDRFASMLLRHGVAKTASKLKVSEGTIRLYKRKYLKYYVPPGNCKKYADNYYIFSDGRVWLRRQFRFSVMQPNTHGYIEIGINGRLVRLNRVVLTLFDRPPKPGEEGRHLDGNPRHNWISNLKWGTAKQNAADKIRHGTDNRGERHGKAKLTEKHVRILRKRYASGEIDIVRRYSTRYGMSYSSVWYAVTRRSWQHV